MLCNMHCNVLNISSCSFWKSVNILLTKPHVINKKLWGCRTLRKYVCKLRNPTNNFPTVGRLTSVNNLQESIDLLIEKSQIDECNGGEDSNHIELYFTELLPKIYSDTRAYQLICIFKDIDKIEFIDITPEGNIQKLCPNITYSFQLVDNRVVLNTEKDYDSASHKWLKETVLPQIIKWGKEFETNNNEVNQICFETLTLVSSYDYYVKYNELKLKYGKKLVEIWPECTDPKKFVYEDIAIASYLLLLWEKQRQENNINEFQSFVDLGCGNGLLVYILTKEGHIGFGIDIRKRQIWEMYSNDVILQEKSIIPSNNSLFPDTSWVIGNHSDELTPWIPIIAARSSYKCNFFLLPCCAFNLDGTKYQRHDSSKSQYIDYLEHLKQSCEIYGFEVVIDRLKIPSTKRICLVSKGRTYSLEEHKNYCKIVQNTIKGNSLLNNNNSENIWLNTFKARNPVEKVRNCTQIDKSIQEIIIKIVSDCLLKDCLETSWSLGTKLEINEVVKLIPNEYLKLLKLECGGLQTLLRNHHNIFQVQKGSVQLRYPKTVNEIKKIKNHNNIKIQQKPCWFFNNHPKGCPLNDTDCTFLHVFCK